jgi:uncharacterized membrane protein (DUF4010 family)
MKSGVDHGSAGAASDLAQRLRVANRRTAWILLLVAIVFFAGIIGTRWIGGTVGIGVMGTLALLFLVVAIGRNLRRTDERVGANAQPGTRQ